MTRIFDEALGRTRHIRRKDRALNRREVLSVIARLRRLRDMTRSDLMDLGHGFGRGAAVGYHMAAHALWSEYENGRS